MIESKLLNWVFANIGKVSIEPLKQEASLRKFYRLQTHPSIVLMDASADKKNKEFIEAALLLKEYQVKVPQIFINDQCLGFFLVEDFGNELLFQHIEANNIEEILQQASQVILKIQSIPLSKIQTPIYFTKSIAQNELNIFLEWFLVKYLELELSKQQKQVLSKTFECILQCLQAQPQVIMHRDFHCKNLMILKNSELGILDFQDLMIGPITYDLVSLLKDCYVTWPQLTINTLLNCFFTHINWNISFENFHFFFDITGLQRHLKVLGGFSKIYLQRGDSRYLQYFDRILDYVIQVTAKYPQFDEFHRLFIAVILPRLFKV